MIHALATAITEAEERIQNNKHTNGSTPRFPMPDLRPLLHSILPYDDASFVFERFGTGLTTHPQQDLERLFHRMVMHYIAVAEARPAGD